MLLYLCSAHRGGVGLLCTWLKCSLSNKRKNLALFLRRGTSNLLHGRVARNARFSSYLCTKALARKRLRHLYKAGRQPYGPHGGDGVSQAGSRSHALLCRQARGMAHHARSDLSIVPHGVMLRLDRSPCRVLVLPGEQREAAASVAEHLSVGKRVRRPQRGGREGLRKRSPPRSLPAEGHQDRAPAL